MTSIYSADTRRITQLSAFVIVPRLPSSTMADASVLRSLCLCTLLLSLFSLCHANTSNQPLSLSMTQSQLLLDLHNSLRSSVTPPSSNMQGLYWDNDLALAAANIAASCPTPTSSSTTATSTNIAYIPPFAADGTQGTTAQLPITNAVTAWTAPAPYYNYKANACGVTSGCQSWLNLVWASTYALGCGISTQQCSSVAVTYANGSQLIGSGYPMVCQYQGGGVSTASQPYAAGLSCAGCPPNFASCSIPSTCVSSSGTCPAVCAVSGGLSQNSTPNLSICELSLILCVADASCDAICIYA